MDLCGEADTRSGDECEQEPSFHGKASQGLFLHVRFKSDNVSLLCCRRDEPIEYVMSLIKTSEIHIRYMILNMG